MDVFGDGYDDENVGMVGDVLGGSDVFDFFYDAFFKGVKGVVGVVDVYGGSLFMSYVWAVGEAVPCFGWDPEGDVVWCFCDVHGCSLVVYGVMVFSFFDWWFWWCCSKSIYNW